MLSLSRALSLSALHLMEAARSLPQNNNNIIITIKTNECILNSASDLIHRPSVQEIRNTLLRLSQSAEWNYFFLQKWGEIVCKTSPFRGAARSFFYARLCADILRLIKRWGNVCKGVCRLSPPPPKNNRLLCEWNVPFLPRGCSQATPPPCRTADVCADAQTAGVLWLITGAAMRVIASASINRDMGWGAQCTTAASVHSQHTCAASFRHVAAPTLRWMWLPKLKPELFHN